MKRVVLACCLLDAASPALSGQSIRVVSEFQRITPGGALLPIDRAAARREILSPAVARNAFCTFRFAVQTPPGEPFTIYIGQNPEATARAAVYREIYVRAGPDWLPGGLQPAALPIQAVLAEGQKAQTYLLDVFIPRSTPEARFRLEIQLHASAHWTIYPMEVRVTGALAPGAVPLRGLLPDPAERADQAAAAALRGALCGAPITAPAFALTSARAILYRNALQDISIARTLSHHPTEPPVLNRIWRAGGWKSRDEFCSGRLPAPHGPEWWLRLRGFLYQGLRLEELEMVN